MLAIAGSEFFRQPKIDHKNCISLAILANKKIIWLYISMDKTLRVNKLYSFKNLESNHQDRFRIKKLVKFFKKSL